MRAIHLLYLIGSVATALAGLVEECDRDPEKCSPDENHFHYNVKDGFCLGNQKGIFSTVRLNHMSHLDVAENRLFGRV